MAGFTITSSGFGQGGQIPARYSCDGENVSPALAWQGAPAATKTLAIIVDDPDAGGFIHWVIFNIPGGAVGYLGEGVRPTDKPPQGSNDFGRTGWGGPCPPGGTHHYRFTAMALSGSLSLTGTPTAADVRAAAESLLLAETTLTATYTRH